MTKYIKISRGLASDPVSYRQFTLQSIKTRLRRCAVFPLNEFYDVLVQEIKAQQKFFSIIISKKKNKLDYSALLMIKLSPSLDKNYIKIARIISRRSKYITYYTNMELFDTYIP